MKNNVLTREDFVSFLLSISADFKENSCDWEHTDISSFLEAMAAWVQDMDGFYLNNHLPLPSNISWSNFADMILAARIYE